MIVRYFREMWHVATRCGPVRHEGGTWTPLLLGAGYTEADAIARAEKLGLISPEPPRRLRRVK
ncbi:hypothetical protein [Pedomonas sp. V897]|uniref:hypothetical protein n=1 Tax=Pedomonas sp. V897 TaxID=3446482 RepID=UPI003EE0F107